MGFPLAASIVGKQISLDGKNKYPIVGVMHDFNSKPLRGPVEPLMLSTNVHVYNFIALRLDPNLIKAALPEVQNTFVHTYPTYIYDLNFFDQRLARFYQSEATVSELFKIAAILAIVISCLGLYGLVSFMAVQKTKEVGIRKVLGASVQSIVYLFSREFTMLIGIAFLISAPLGYLFMHKWLYSFYYHVGLGWEVFALAISLSVLIAWATVGYKAMRSALANPVRALRSE